MRIEIGGVVRAATKAAGSRLSNRWEALVFHINPSVILMTRTDTGKNLKQTQWSEA